MKLLVPVCRDRISVLKIWDRIVPSAEFGQNPRSGARGWRHQQPQPCHSRPQTSRGAPAWSRSSTVEPGCSSISTHQPRLHAARHRTACSPSPRERGGWHLLGALPCRSRPVLVASHLRLDQPALVTPLVAEQLRHARVHRDHLGHDAAAGFLLRAGRLGEHAHRRRQGGVPDSHPPCAPRAWGARLPRVGSRAPPRGGARLHPGEPGSPAPLRAPREEVGCRPRGRTGCAGFVHPSHPSSLQKHTFAHLWPGGER